MRTVVPVSTLKVQSCPWSSGSRQQMIRALEEIQDGDHKGLLLSVLYSYRGKIEMPRINTLL